MSRTRCVQFYWRKFCRLIKYCKCLQASREIKQKLREKVNIISQQY